MILSLLEATESGYPPWLSLLDINSLALKFINKNANSDNVLMILQHLYVLHQKDREEDESYTPSAPPLELLDETLARYVSNTINRPDVDKERHHKSH